MSECLMVCRFPHSAECVAQIGNVRCSWSSSPEGGGFRRLGDSTRVYALARGVTKKIIGRNAPIGGPKATGAGFVHCRRVRLSTNVGDSVSCVGSSFAKD